jgi:HEPN domain-containing protein
MCGTWSIQMTRDELIAHWLESAEDNFCSMQNMFASGEFVWSLFVGHLCIEKLLKACYVKYVDAPVPRIHDLYKLADRSGLIMTEEQKDALQYVGMFNIEARYEEYKREFHQKCTKAFAEQSIATIKELRAWLLEKTNN